MEKFTKGPWRVGGDVPSRIYGMMRDDKEVIVAATGSVNPCSGANAHLIAAAPEMYKMLKSIIDPDINVDSVICGIADLLEKARGE